MRRRALLAVLALPVACGARTPLLPGGPGDTGSAGSGGGGGGATPLAVACNAALLDGAPTPIQGYCTTRANQAPLAGPRAPTIAWSVTPFPIVSPEDYLPAETVVDATGRAFVAINVSPQAPANTLNQLFAVDDDGSAGRVAWMSTSVSSIEQLALGRDGRLWFVQQGVPGGAGGGGTGCQDIPCTSYLTELSAGGENLATVIPSLGSSVTSFDLMAIASDGTFFVGSPGLARLATNGPVLWQTYADFGAAILVGPDDGVFAVGGGETDAIDAAGGTLWSGPSGDLGAVNAQGQVVVLSIEDGSLSLMTLGPDGVPVMNVTLGSPQFTIDAYQLAVAGDGTAIVLLADEATSPGITKAQLQIIAVEASGKTRWTTPLDVSLPYDPADLTTHYGLFVDAAGTVVVTAGAVMGLDLASGSVLWTLQSAKPDSCLRPAVLGLGGSILATQCDGTVFLARDP